MTRQCLLQAGAFGDPATLSVQERLTVAFEKFKLWRKQHQIPCSQKRFTVSNLIKNVHGFYFTCKAYNGRIVLEFLAQECADFARANPNHSPELTLTSLAMLLSWCSILWTFFLPITHSRV